MKYHIWTDEEIQILNDYYPTHGINATAKILNVSRNTIIGKTRDLGIKISKSYLCRFRTDLCNVDANYYINCKTPEAAYFLGFLWADGCITGTNQGRYQIMFCIKEEDARNVFPIFDKAGKWTVDYKNIKSGSRQGRARSQNKQLYDFLFENDYKSKDKSADKILSKIPEELKCYFFQGLLDGDGCIYYNDEQHRLEFAGPYDQDWSYIETIYKKLNIKYSIYRRISKKKVKDGSRFMKGSTIIVQNLEDILIFCKFIYPKLIGLRRKYEKYLFLDHRYHFINR